MNKYIIYCTPEQTKIALNLGAPIAQTDNRFDDEIFSPIYKDNGKWIYADIPTAEQMLGWLEEQGIMFNIAVNPFNEFKVILSKAGDFLNNIANIKWNKSRREATLAAIDAALEYLSNNKK